MKSNLTSLNDMLYEQLERINDDELKGDELKEQLAKSKMINDVAKTIVANSTLMFRAIKYADENGIEDETKLLEVDRR